MRRTKMIFSAVAATTIAASSAAWGATTLGRITYISPDGHRIVVDSSDEYVLGPKVDGSKLEIAQFVKLTYSEQNGQRVATDIGPGPAAAAK